MVRSSSPPQARPPWSRIQERPRHRVRFPPPGNGRKSALGQDEAFFHLVDADGRHRIRFHDYGEIYRHAGLYEQLFYDRLKCQSPRKVAQVLTDVVLEEGAHPSELRVLDFGAGNGMGAEALNAFGVARLVGVDIEPEARNAVERDRPGLYDQYYVADFTDLDDDLREELLGWSVDCLCCVAALGFGDIPPTAFLEALNLTGEDAWVAFNIKETFLDAADSSGFSRMIRNLILSDQLDLYHLERYRHRLSIDGTPLHYFAIVARKRSERIPRDFAEV